MEAGKIVSRMSLKVSFFLSIELASSFLECRESGGEALFNTIFAHGDRQHDLMILLRPIMDSVQKKVYGAFREFF